MRERKLKDLMEKFIYERIEYNGINLGAVVHFQTHLIGSSLPLLHLGFLRFLMSLGHNDPTIKFFNSYYVGKYWEFLIQHYGAIQAGNAMTILRKFWIWSKQNKYTMGKMPADFLAGNLGATDLFKINVSISPSSG